MVRLIVISGHQMDEHIDLLLAAKKLNIQLLGWHVNERAGFDKDHNIYNITTDPQDVIKLTLAQIYKSKLKKIGIIIFTDNQFQIAQYKTELIKKEIKKCKRCTILKIVNFPIANIENELRSILNQLNMEFKDKWTHSLAVNDNYFDIENPRSDVIVIAAGSLKAIRRIKKNSSRQFASIAEPIYAQGWQIANELYRRFQQDAQVNVLLLPIILDYDFLKDIQETQIEPISVIREKYMKVLNIPAKKK